MKRTTSRYKLQPYVGSRLQKHCYANSSPSVTCPIKLLQDRDLSTFYDFASSQHPPLQQLEQRFIHCRQMLNKQPLKCHYMKSKQATSMDFNFDTRRKREEGYANIPQVVFPRILQKEQKNFIVYQIQENSYTISSSQKFTSQCA